MCRKPVLSLIAAIGLLALAGCGKPAAEISGSVSYEGRPVESGWISFLPADGNGPTCGGRIANGAYRVKIVAPGKKMVQIIGVKHVNFAKNTQEMADAAKDAAKKADSTGIIERADVIPADAEGNNTVVNVSAGGQRLDFSLKPSAGKRKL